MAQNNPSISIVMPVYNPGIFLEESLNSIIKQTYRDWALLCMDDCSDEEETLRILDEYSKKDERISVYHMSENSGAPVARNKGMEMVNGEFIIFLDADDVFDEDMLEKMYESITENSADVCVCGFRWYSQTEDRVYREENLIQVPGVTDRAFNITELGEMGLQCWYLTPWDILCRRKLIMDNNIKFLNLSSYNDVTYAGKVAISAKRIVYCNDGLPLVTYRNDVGTQITAKREPMDAYRSVNAIFEWLEEPSVEIYKQLLCLLAGTSLQALRSAPDEDKKREYYSFVSGLFREKLKKYSFDNVYMSFRFKCFMTLDYDSDWFNNLNFDGEDYYIKLLLNKELLLTIIPQNKACVLWGNGKRGKAFQKLWGKYGNHKLIVTDQIITEVAKTEEGFDIVPVKEIDVQESFIIASNNAIKEELIKKYGLNEENVLSVEEHSGYGYTH